MGPRVIDIPMFRVFTPFNAPSRYKGAHGGRGSGKSQVFADMIIRRCLTHPGTRVVCIREVQKTLDESAKKLIGDKIKAHGVGDFFDIQHNVIKTPGGGVIIFQGMQDHNAQSIKSLEGFDIAWVEEAQTLSALSWELLRPTIRKEGSEIWCSWNPRHSSDPIDAFFRQDPPDNAIVVQANYSDNPFFSPELEAERQYDKEHNPDRYEHIWEGAYEPVAIGAQFTRKMFKDHRVKEAPPLTKITVNIDPAGKDKNKNPKLDEHGITATGLGEDGRGYLLADSSGGGTPHEWATRALALYDLLEADEIVVETNNGGDMVASTIKSIRPHGVQIHEVTATRGKHIRSAPISALYALGRISHVGSYPEVEDQMCQFTDTGYQGPNSPDRAESAFWGFTRLLPEVQRGIRRPPPQQPDRTVSTTPGGWMA